MKLSNIRDLKIFCESLESKPDYLQVITAVVAEDVDFEIDNVRFIRDDEILKILADELTSDPSILGCFNAGFIADNCKWPVRLVEAAQEGGFYESLPAIADYCDMLGFAEEYARADGFGHHFNIYDSGEELIEINGHLYHVFDNH